MLLDALPACEAGQLDELIPLQLIYTRSVQAN